MVTGQRPLHRIFASIALALFVAPATLPHVHAASAHEAEICAGHLDHEGAADLDHAGSCVRCPSVRRDVPRGPAPALCLVQATSESAGVPPRAEPRHPGAEPREGRSPRSPPPVSFRD